MDDKILAALKGSIKHWEENADNDEFNAEACSAEECPLCAMFNPYIKPDMQFLEKQMIGCAGCPVKLATGHDFCNNTPYYCAQNYHEVWGEEEDDDAKKAFQAEAKKEVAFLVSLLPEGERT